CYVFFFFSSRRRHTSCLSDWSSDVCSSDLYNASINGTLVGESGILAAIAGCWDIPAVFVSGDEATCREVTALLGEEVVTVPVKRSEERRVGKEWGARWVEGVGEEWWTREEG